MCEKTLVDSIEILPNSIHIQCNECELALCENCKFFRDILFAPEHPYDDDHCHVCLYKLTVEWLNKSQKSNNQ